jgi:tryptophan synthase alpha chain
MESIIHSNRIYTKFRELKLRNRPALICFIVGGYPTIAHTELIVSSLVKAGADMIEIGIPFSDPIADGPTIQEAYNVALKNGVTPQMCLRLCAKLRKKFPNLPLLIMTYSNIVFKAGLAEFIKSARLHGVDGFILPDMAVVESADYVKVTSDHGLATIFLASPNSSKHRIKQIMDVCSGFIYVVSIFGITGTRLTYEKYTFQNIRKIKHITHGKIPIAVGFGISRPDQIVSIVKSGADAVIIGSSLIDHIKVSANHKLKLNELQTYVRQLKAACSRVQISFRGN